MAENIFKKAFEKQKKLYYNEELVIDPSKWLDLGMAYHQLYSFVSSQLSPDDIRNPEKNRINFTLPYIASISAELYMKGFLVSGGMCPEEIKKFRHDLILLRKECISKDSRFSDSIMDNFIEFESLINMPEGGIKYPRNHIFIHGSHQEDSLNLLKTILEKSIKEKSK